MFSKDKFRAERRHRHKEKALISKNPKFRTDRNVKRIKSDEYEDYGNGNMSDDFVLDYGKNTDSSFSQSYFLQLKLKMKYIYHLSKCSRLCILSNIKGLQF